MSDIVVDTARRAGVEYRSLFDQAARHYEHSKATTDDRFARWLKYGEIPEWVTDHLLEHYYRKESHAPIL